MERDNLRLPPPLPHRRSSCLSGCIVSSPSCFPVHEEMEYTRIHSSSKRSSRRWRHLIRRLVIGSLSSSSKPLSFHYDAISYSQNFDEGCRFEEY
ncbi:uncharacterized protein LOC126656228 [Mercurialis annua]|uniref:uncharacterized protein LOC126656228 n=1 Tax=Mercurialis annua TaxID=3986 RepID=UPI002160B1B0|nr:uncharacterized protein LOC126656228 [Mercurialis annua]